MHSYYNIKEIKLSELLNYHSCVLISYKKTSKRLSAEFFTLLKKYICYTDFVKINTDNISPRLSTLIGEGITFFIKDKTVLTFPTLTPDWKLFDKTLDNFINKTDEDFEKGGCLSSIFECIFILEKYKCDTG